MRRHVRFFVVSRFSANRGGRRYPSRVDIPSAKTLLAGLLAGIAAWALSFPAAPVRAAVSANLVLLPTGVPAATASAIEQYSTGYTAAMAIDGGTGSQWAAIGYSAGDWWRGDWSRPVAIDRIKLYPRGASCDNFGYGRFVFSDGSETSFDVRSHTTSSPVTVDFTRKTNILWVKIVSDGGGGSCNPGLAEVEAWDTTTSSTYNLFRPVTTNTFSASNSYSSAWSADKAGDASTTTQWAGLGYSAGAWWQVQWSQGQALDRVKLFPRSGSCETFGYGTIHFSDTSTVSFDLRSYTNSSSPLTLNFTRRTGITSMKVVSDGGGGGCNPGLAEVEAYDTTPPPAPSLAGFDTASDTGFLHEVEGQLTLRPNSDVSISNTTFSSGTTGWSLVDEETLNTGDWVKPGNNGYAYFGFTDSGLPAAQPVSRIVIRANVSNNAPAGGSSISVRRPSDGELDHVGTVAQSFAGDKDVTLTTRSWDDRPWTVADVEALQVGVTAPSGYANMTLRQLRVEVYFPTRIPPGYASDGITADNTPTLSGTVEAGASRVDLYSYGTLVGSDTTVSTGSWSITTDRLSDGMHLLRPRATNAAGESADGPVRLITVDTAIEAGLTAESDTAPPLESTPIAKLRPSADVSITGDVVLSTGSTGWNLVDEALLRTSDNLNIRSGSAVFAMADSGLPAGKRINTVKFEARVRNPAPAPNGSLFVRDPATGTTYPLLTIVQNAPAAQTVSLGSRPWDSLPWTVSDVDNLQVGVDCGCGSFPNLRLDQLWVEVTYSDTTEGAYGSDGITNISAPTLEGTSGPNATRIDILDGQTAIASDTISGDTWQIDLSALDDGSYELDIEIYDGDDVLTGSGEIGLTVDTGASSSPSTPDLDSASDTGVSNSDGITSDTTPTFSGSAPSGSVFLELTAGDGRIATTTTFSQGAWSATAAQLVPGEYDVAARTYDAAGNSATSASLHVEVVASLVRLRAYTTPHGDVGSVSYVSVVVEDEMGEPVTNYTGTISLSSTDSSVSWPDGNTYAMQASTNSSGHTFRVVFGGAGDETVTASAAGAISGTTASVTVSDGRLELSAPEVVHTGVPFALRVAPLRADGTMERQYRGQVTLSSSDSSASFGPEVNAAHQYQFECGCGDGHTFATTLSSTGTQTITVQDSYGHSDQVSVDVVAAPTSGADPLAAVSAVRWNYGSITDYYIDASAPIQVLSVEDWGTGNSLLLSSPVLRTLPAGHHSFSVGSSQGGNVVAGDWYDVAAHKIWYTNAEGRAFSRSFGPIHRFVGVPSSTSYVELDPGDPIQSWQVIARTRTSTTLQITAYEPFVIANINYSFQGTLWQPAPGEYYIAAGTTQVEMNNDPATCYVGNTYRDNNSIRFDTFGLASGRVGRVVSGIADLDEPYSGTCTTDPPPGNPPHQDWLVDVLQALGQSAESLLSLIGDPIDSSDGYPHGPVTDIALGGLSPGFEFSRTYDGELAEAGMSGLDTLLGAGWSSNLDWRIETFGTDPDGVVIRGGDGHLLAFLRRSDGSYIGVGGIPFTFAEVQGGFELRRLDKSGYRFTGNGRLAAVVDRVGREMTLSYDAAGALSSVTDAAGRSAEFTLNAASQVTGIELPDGRQTAYDYDASERLIRVTDLGGSDIEYVHDRVGRIIGIKDANGATVLANLYDGSGRVIRQTDGAGVEIALTYDEERGTTQIVDGRGQVTTRCFDQNGRLATSYDAGDGQRRTNYDSYGHPREVVDELGNSTSISNDELGRPTHIIDPLGREITLDYNNAGDLITLDDPEGRTIGISYAANGLPDSITLTNGSNTKTIATYDYDANDQLASVTEPGGAMASLTYDSDGYLSVIVDPEGGETTLVTNSAGYVTSVVDPLGNANGGIPADHRWQFAYDPMGRLTSSTDPSGGITERTYDALGRLATVTDPTGLITTYEYDGAGRPLTVAVDGPSLSAETAYEYDAAGNVAAVTDAEGRRTEFVHDALGRIVERLDPGGNSWHSEYDAKGRVVSVSDPTDRQIFFSYDAADRLLARTDAGGETTEWTYDEAGRIIAVTDPLSNTVSYSYDWLGRLTEITDSLDNVTSFGYNAANDVAATTNGRGKTTSFEYDAAHRLTKAVDALLGETHYEYDAAGRLIGRENARGNSETYEYDAAGRLVRTTDPLDHSWQTVFDANGRIDHTIDANGSQTDFSVDDLGHPLTISPENGQDITFSYDLTGRRLSMTDANGTSEYAYDAVGHLSGTTRGGRHVGYEYDDAGRLSSVSYPGTLGDVSLGYDAKGRLATVTDWVDRETSFGYDVLDRIVSISRPGNSSSAFGYDALGRITSVEHAYGGSPMVNLGYSYDEVGNVVERTDDQGTSAFTYDDLDRLIGADYPGADDYSYSYDAVGNLTGAVTPDGTFAHSYDAADRFADSGYSYDANGSLLADGTRTYTYDDLARLTGVSTGATSVTYELDGDGNRWSETADGVTTQFDLDLRGLPTLLVAGDKAFLPGMPNLGYSTANSWINSFTDAQGSVLATIDGAGTMSALARFDPYGAPRPGMSFSSGFGYAGEWTDPSGLINLRFRAYDPVIGRFLSRDTFGGVAGLSQSANRYGYGLGNPLRYTDPSGHFVNNVLIPGGGWLLGFGWGFGSAVFDALVDLGQLALCLQPGNPCAIETMIALLQKAGQAVSDISNDPSGSLANLLFSLSATIGDLHDRLTSPDGYTAGYAAGEVTVFTCYVYCPVAVGRLVAGAGAATAAGEVVGTAESAGGRIVIGKMADITAEGAIGPGERTLLDQLPNLGSPKLNWAQNERVLLQEMAGGTPIRDATVDQFGNLANNTGYLALERAVLERAGWTYDPATHLWSRGY